MINKKILGVMALALVMIVGACPAFAAQQNNATQAVTVTVNPTLSISVNSPVNFGSLDADGLTTTQTSTLTSKSNIAIDVWVRALNFQANQTAADPLTLTDFTYGASSTAFLNTYQLPTDLTNIGKAPKNSQIAKTLALNINVPFGTSPATYNTTVYYAAVPHGQTTAPTTP